MATKCPVCTADHPTGQFRQTFGGLEHYSRECGYVASHAGIDVRHLADAKTMRMLQAGKRHFEERGGIDAQCNRCGAIVAPGEDCTRCGAWQMG